ncbi:MAG: DUF3822 family protein [Dysgonamonadaceae bacterium]|jgi:hypothetical protein|nr:DUF3822 family protein [Dysgonamonadaceae bacterium]
MKIDIPKTINLNTPGKYVLTIYVHPEKFSFSFHCPDEKGSYFFYKINSTGQSDAFSVFKDLFFENEFFAYPFQKTCVLVFSSLFTYIPDAIYSDKYKTDFIKFIFSEKEEKMLDDSVSSAKLKILYPVSEDVYDFFIRSFNEPEFVHYSAPLIAYFLSPDIKHKKQQMIVNVHEKGIDVLCFSRESFLLGNHFPCEKFQDAVYYILYTWKQLKMNRFSDSLCVTGERFQNEELIKKLWLHIQHVHPEPIPHKYRFEAIGAGNIPFELAVFSLCES